MLTDIRTNGRTDQRTDRPSYRDARTHLKRGNKGKNAERLIRKWLTRRSIASNLDYQAIWINFTSSYLYQPMFINKIRKMSIYLPPDHCLHRHLSLRPLHFSPHYCQIPHHPDRKCWNRLQVTALLNIYENVTEKSIEKDTISASVRLLFFCFSFLSPRTIQTA